MRKYNPLPMGGNFLEINLKFHDNRKYLHEKVKQNNID